MTQQRRPLLIYDGDCLFCIYCVEYARKVTGAVVDYQPYQAVAKDHPGISPDAFKRAVQLIEPDGHVTSAAAAVFRALAYAPGKGFPLWMYRRVPGFKWVSETMYRWVARNRGKLSKMTPWF